MKRRHKANSFLNAHGGGGGFHAMGGSHFGGSISPHPIGGGAPSVQPHGGSGLSGGTGVGGSSLGVGVGGVGLVGTGLVGGLGVPYVGGLVDPNMVGSWSENPSNNESTASTPALVVVTPTDGKWENESYEWLVIEVPANEAGLHKVVFGKKSNGEIVNMKNGMKAIESSKYSTSSDQSPMSEYHYSEGTGPYINADGSSLTLPVVAKALPIIALVGSAAAIWYIDKHKPTWGKNKLHVGIFAAGVIAVSFIPVVYFNSKKA